MKQLKNYQPMVLSHLPVNALKAFEVTARHLSLTRAAEELNVTPGAVGRQVHALEEKLQLKLFDREGNRLALTPAGLSALPRIHAAFQDLCLAIDEMKAVASAPALTISVDISFAAMWLSPKLSMYRKKEPSCDIRIVPPLGLSAPIPKNIDLVITYSREGFENYDIEMLHHETLFPVCTPRYLENSPSLAEPSDLSKHQLISVDSSMRDDPYPGWDEWSEKFEVESLANNSIMHSALAILAMQASLTDQGIALLSRSMVSKNLQSGELTAPLGAEFRLEMPRYIVSHQENKSDACIQLKSWLLANSDDIPSSL